MEKVSKYASNVRDPCQTVCRFMSVTTWETSRKYSCKKPDETCSYIKFCSK